MTDASPKDFASYEELQQAIFHELSMKAYDIEVEESPVQELLIHTVEGDAFQVIDEEDRDILLQREAHFGGSFVAMEEYYQNPERIGVVEALSPNRIAFLADVERRLGQNIAPKILSGRDAEHIARAKKTYDMIAELSHNDVQNEMPSSLKLFLRLINDEGELNSDEFALSDMEKNALLRDPKPLLQLASSDEFRDPLFPGFGKAPLRALQALAKSCVQEALPLFFRLLATAQEEEEEELLGLIPQFGEAGFEYARRTFLQRPVTPFHEKLILLLVKFMPTHENEMKMLLLQELESQELYSFPSVLQWVIVGLSDLDEGSKHFAKERLLTAKLPLQLQRLMEEVL